MYTRILIGFGILIFGVALSRSIQTMQFKRIGAEKRDKLLRDMRRFRFFALTLSFVAVILFIAGIIVIPEAFPRLSRLMILFGVIYSVLLNVIGIIYYFRARCGGVFVVITLFSKVIVFCALILFCYFVVTAF